MTLTAKHINLKLQQKQVLADVNFTLRPGELVVMLGPNGAGKTTLVNILSGVKRPSFGEVLLHDRLIYSWPQNAKAKILGVLPQQSKLNFGFDVIEVVMLGRTPYKSSRREDVRIAQHCLAEVDGLHLIGRDYMSLSSGEQQRVHLARVIAQVSNNDRVPAKYLLLDEPTASLDLWHQHGTLSIAKKLSQHGYGVLAVLHDLNLASQYADRVVIVNQGKIIGDGSPRTILTADMIQHVFATQVLITEHPDSSADYPLIVPQMRTH